MSSVYFSNIVGSFFAFVLFDIFLFRTYSEFASAFVSIP